MVLATVIATVLLAILFTFASSIKLFGAPQSLAIRDHLGVTPVFWRVIGLLELAGVIGALAGLGLAADRRGRSDRSGSALSRSSRLSRARLRRVRQDGTRGDRHLAGGRDRDTADSLIPNSRARAGHLSPQPVAGSNRGRATA